MCGRKGLGVRRGCVVGVRVGCVLTCVRACHTCIFNTSSL